MKLQTICCVGKILNSPYFVRMFGQFIRKLRIRNISDYAPSQATRYENCTQLRELAFIDCDLALLWPTIVRTEAQELEKLSLARCQHNGEEFTQILRYFANVKRIMVHNFSLSDYKFLGYKYPQLKEIRCIIAGIPRRSFKATESTN